MLIGIDIDCGKENCEKCHFLYSDHAYKMKMYCRLFEMHIGDAKDGEIERMYICHEAEDRV
jgi:hypothetical protein